MKLFITTLLYGCSLLIALPIKSTAAFYVPNKAVVRKMQTPAFVLHTPHTCMRQFHGSRQHDFSGTFGLSCSILGSVALIAALGAVALAAPAVGYAVAAYGLSILGIVFGFISHSDTSGANAVALGVVNLLVMWLAGAIYHATMGDFVPLLKFLLKFLLAVPVIDICQKRAG